MEEEATLLNQKSSPKEVSNKLVIILVIVAILVSVVGTYLVYDKASEFSNTKTIGNIVSTNNQGSTVGVVGVEITPKQNQESENQ